MTEQIPYLTSNVIPKGEFEKRSQRVFQFMADTVSRTLGPFGSTTIIETNNDYKVTKDGWNLLKSINFNNPVEQNMAMLLINIAQRQVRKVGDGSTSSVVSAHYLLNRLTQYANSTNVRSKQLLDDLNLVTSLIEGAIRKASTRVDTEGDFQEIYNVAHISTNGNDEISKLLQEAYQQTRSTSIQYTKSRSHKNELEVIEGYQSKIGYLDPVFVNTDNDTGVYTRPHVLMFDHTVEKEYHLEFIMDAYMKAQEAGVAFLLLAPYYDNAMHETFAYLCNREKAQYGEIKFVVGRAALISNHERNMFKDLSALLGAKIVTENIINEYNKKKTPREERERTFNTRLAGEANEYIETDPSSHIGSVGKVSLGKRFTLFEDFNNTNQYEFEMCVLDANNKLKAQIELDEETGILNHDGFYLEERVIKLNRKTAIIKAGGATTLEKGANYDLLEDAVKASASAYKQGFNLGGNLSIALAVKNVRDEFAKGDINLSEPQLAILEEIGRAFANVFTRVLENAQLEEEYDYATILNNAASGKGCINIVTGEYDQKVINPTMTDIEILKGAISIVSMMISSNQYVSLTANISVN